MAKLVIVVIVIGVVLLSLFVVGFLDIVSSFIKCKVNGGKAADMKMRAGLSCMMPVIAIAACFGIMKIGRHLENRDSIEYQVRAGTADGLERLLKKCSTPDCGFDGVPAKSEKFTLLSDLAYHNINRPECREKMKLLIDSGADVNWQVCLDGEHGKTPLMLLCYSPGEQVCEIAELLIESGAEINAEDSSGKTELDILEKEIGTCTRKDHSARLEELRMVLVSSGAKNSRGSSG